MRLQFFTRKKWQELRFLAFGWTVLPLTLMLILAVGATSVILQSTVKTMVETRNADLAQLAAARLADQLTGQADHLRVLAAQPAFKTMALEQMPAVFDAYSYLPAPPAGGGIVVLDAGGVALTGYPLSAGGPGRRYTPPAIQALPSLAAQTPLFLDVFVEAETGRPMVGIAVPVYDEAGRFAGSLLGRYYLDNRRLGAGIYQNTGLSGATVYLVDREGHVIFHPQAEFIGSDFSARPEVRAFWAQPEVGAGLFEGEESGRTVVGYAPLASIGWGIFVAESWTQAVWPLRLSVIFIAAILTLGTVGLSFVVLWAVRRITEPLEKLARQTRQIAAGDYKTHVGLSRIKEIRALGRAFNHMVNQLGSYRAGLQEYVASVTDSQEEERKRIARDLHDGTVQNLIAIGQQIELAREMLGEQSVADSRRQLTEVRAMVKESIAGIRQFSRDLRPLALEDLGLIPALQYLVGRLEQDAGVSAQLEIEGDASGLSPDLEVAIFRVTQEALSNIKKHARADRVMVVVRFLHRQTLLEIRDNGVGFDVPENTTDLARNGSFGLLGLEERANLFGGDISIQSALNKGTIIRAILPHKQLPRRRESDMS